MTSTSDISRIQLLIASALLPAQLLIFNVLTIGAGNQQYLATSLLSLLAFSAVAFFAISTLIYLVSGALVPKDQRTMAWFVLPSAFILVWIQSQLLIWDYGGLTGASIDWGDFPWQGYVDVTLWVTGIAAVYLFRKRIRHRLLHLAGLVAVLQFAVVGYTGVPYLLDGSKSSDQAQGLESISRYSAQGNVIQLVVDGFQSDILEELLQHDPIRLRYGEEFRGFTFYRENMSVFPYTQFSIPSYLAAAVYRNERQKEEFIDGVLSADTIASAARQSGYSVDLAVSGPYLTQRHAMLPHDSLIDIDEIMSSDRRLSDLMLAWDISLFRAVPHFFKSWIYNDQRWLLSQMVVSDVRESLAYFRHTKFLNRLSETMTAETADKTAPGYKLIHIQQTHRPMVVNPQCEYAGGTLPDTRTTLAVQTACTLETVMGFLNRLKELELYDRSLIVIHGDHGGWVPTLRDGRHVPLGDGEAPEFAASLASALLMVKPPGATQSLEISDALTSLIDIPDTISSLMNWGADFGRSSVFAIDEDQPRARKYMFYFWHRDEWANDFTQPIFEYTIEGSHFETDWKQTAVYPSERGLRID